MAPPAKSLTPEIVAMLKQATHRRFAAKSLIMSEGQKPDSLYFLVSGSVTVLIEDADGDELILAYLGPGEFFGELGLFEPNIKRSACVRARTECEVAAIGYERFRALTQTLPGLLLLLTAQIARRLRATSQQLGNLAFLDVAGRIARALLQLAHDSQAISHPQGMLVRITREELGRLVSCSAKMTGRVLRSLEQQGLITVHGKSIVVIGAPEKQAYPVNSAAGDIVSLPSAGRGQNDLRPQFDKS